MPKNILAQRDFDGIPLKKMLRAIAGNIYITPIDIGDTRFDLEIIRSSEQLLSEIDEKAFRVDERLPYWSELWPSAIALAEYILENQSDFYQKKVLETGCGLGLAGLAARKAGAELTMSDNDPLALYFANRNYRRSFGHTAETVHLDWRGPFLDRKFDVIIGADILYEKRFFADLYQFLHHHLISGGVAVLAEPQRTVAQKFFEDLPRDRWIKSVVEKEIHNNDRMLKININILQAC